MNKNISLIFNVVLAIAVIILFILFFKQKNSSNSVAGVASTFVDSSKTALLPIAYVNVDSLLLNYKYAKDANEALMKEQENSRATINYQMRQLQSEVADFQHKLDNNAFLSRQRAEEEQARLSKKQDDLQQLNAKLSDQLMQKQQKVSEALRDTINSFLKTFNEAKKFQLILSNTSNDNILWGDKGLDITKEVIDALNKRMK